MLIALPNIDGSFYRDAVPGAQRRGQLRTRSPRRRRSPQFSPPVADAVPLMPDLLTEFASHPQGSSAPCTSLPEVAGRVLLLGDAAHAIVPFTARA